MKVCPKCGAQVDDHATFCGNCGCSMMGGQMNYQQPMYDPYDHTAEFDPRDISDNKVMAMLPYLLGIFGTIITLLATRESRYAYFHVRQALKFTVVETLIGLISLVLFWTFIVPIVAGVMYFILWIIKIICFFQVCSGKAKEPAIIKSLGFLR